VELWIARPLGEPQRPLVFHLTGDSGRHGLDLLLFTALTRWGYPVATVASPAWANTLPDRVATPRALAADLDLLSRTAARAAGLPEDRSFVLLGHSRGAGLAVEAASEPPLSSRLLGVVALGLCDVEELVHRGQHASRPYRDREFLGALPLEVIQSTHDRYMDAAAARAVFGPDREYQRLHAIEARSHTFAGNREAPLDQLRDSLEQIRAREETNERSSPRR
jgi:pimeloyl-ACP methyl ester carboxylesterase